MLSFITFTKKSLSFCLLFFAFGLLVRPLQAKRNNNAGSKTTTKQVPRNSKKQNRKNKKNIPVTSVQPPVHHDNEVSISGSITPPQTALLEDNVAIPIRKIRVLLEEHDASKETKFIIKAKHGFVLESPIDSGITAVYQEDDLRIVCKNSKLYLCCRDKNYRRIKNDSIEICDPHYKLTIGGTTYQGSLAIIVDHTKNVVMVINKLPLEDYVYAVVRCESIPTWPLDMQKIQAIISRSYAVYLMQQARLRTKSVRYYDIKNTNLHQVYNGTHKAVHLRQAVEETQNLILTYKNNVALTMFDICCGGSTPALMRKNDNSKPYLCRKERCLYCTACPNYSWKEDMLSSRFLALFNQHPKIAPKLKNFKTIESIKMSDIDKAGLVHKIKLFDKNNRSISLTDRELQSALQHRIKSLSFQIKKVNDRIIITGKGFGHQRGICQWGCKELLRRNWPIKKILSFYYPGTKLSKLL